MLETQQSWATSLNPAFRTAVQDVAEELIGSAVSADVPLMQAGLDSLGATEFHNRLSAQNPAVIEGEQGVPRAPDVLRSFQLHQLQ